MEAAHRGRPRGRLRHRARKRTRSRSLAAQGRPVRAARCRTGAEAVLRGAAADHPTGGLGGGRHLLRRAAAARRPRTRHAPVPRVGAAAGPGPGLLGHRQARRRHLPRRAATRPGRRAPGRPHDLPAEVPGAVGLPRDGLAARSVLPDLPGVRGGRGAHLRRRLRARPAGSSAGAGRGPTTPPRSRCGTAGTCRRAGRAMPTCSPSSCWRCSKAAGASPPRRRGRRPSRAHCPRTAWRRS